MTVAKGTKKAEAQATWLELLLRDAEPTDLEHLRQQQIDSGLTPDVVEAEARRALQLRTLLRDRAQRVSDMAALSDIAARLASVRDVDELLVHLSQLARQLLRTDVAYLALVEDDALQIKYFDGMLGPAAEHLHLSMTAGLAGRIVSTGRPAWTSDYLADPTIVHQHNTDEFASDEQLRSILGVPLRARETTIGVLFAAERSHRPFVDSEVSLLAGLAGHAAVAIENARLFDAERQASDQLRAANDDLHASAAAVDRAVALHDRLTEAVVRGGGPAQVVRALSDVLDVPVQLVDAFDRPLAGPELDGPSPAALTAESGRRTIVLPTDAGGSHVLCPVVAAEDYLGCLVVERPTPADDADVRLLERGAMGIALALVHERAVADAATRSRGELLSALVDGGEPDTMHRRAAAIGVDLDRTWLVLLAQAEDQAAAGAVADLAGRHNGLYVDRAGRLLALLPADADLAGLDAHVTGGISEPVKGAAALPEAYAAARRCLHALLALGRDHCVADADRLGVYRFLLSSGGTDEAMEFVRRTVGPLLDHDERRGTDLTRTLEAYLDNGRQHSATADALHIHANTLYQRLNRIGAVLGEQWRDPDAALDLHVALRLRRVATRF